MEEKNKINLLAFYSCKEKECDCGCNIHLGMKREDFVRFWKLILDNFKVNEVKKIEIEEYLDFSKKFGGLNI